MQIDLRIPSLAVKFIIALCLSFSFVSSALGDDALLKVYGGVLHLSDGESTTIQMEAETVKIYLHKDTYTVDATFEFFNHGKTETVKVGFPKKGHGYAPQFRGPINFILFESWVNDEKTPVKEQIGEVWLNHQKLNKTQIKAMRNGKLSGWLEENRWLVKQVTFEGNAKTVTRVKYEAPYDSNLGEGIYIYGTGRSWVDNITKARFIINASPDVAFSGAVFSENDLPKTRRQYPWKRISEFEYEFILDNIKPKENEMLSFYYYPREEWHVADFIEVPVERKHIESLTFWQLRVLRNWIYAKHGKIFTDPELNKYFIRQDWYKPSNDFKEADLSTLEKENIAAIASYEKELKTNLHRK